MNRMEKPNKSYLSKPRKRLGIFSLVMDAVYVILGLSFYHYNNLPSFYQNILSYVWIALMAAALIAALVGIFTSKEYELFRSCMFETVILAVQGVWLGASSSLMLVKNQTAPFPMYFLIGLFCLLAIGLFVQIDATWFRSIMHFMMKGGDNMVEIETQPQAKPASTPQVTVHQGTVTLDTTHLKRSTMRRQTKAHPKIQVIDQNEARNAVKQAQAKARAKQVLAEDFEKRSRSTSRTAHQSAEKRTAQPRRAEKRTTTQSQPRPKREPIFTEVKQETPAHQPERTPSRHTKPVQVQRQAATTQRQKPAQPRVHVQQPESKRRADTQTIRQAQPARQTAQPAADATTKWEPRKVRQAEASAKRTAQLKARKSAMRTHTPSASAAETASHTETPQWATQRKRRPKTHHYTNRSSRLFIRDDDDE